VQGGDMAAKEPVATKDRNYLRVFDDVAELLEASRAASARSINALMTATYWLVGRRIFEGEQQGKGRADYGAQLVWRLADDLSARFGRGFGRANLFQMRAFFLAYRETVQTASGQSGGVKKVQTASGQLARQEVRIEEALVQKLETFLLELGGAFAFVGRQRRLRVGDEWYKVDLVFFHRELRCLVIIDLKLGKFTHADAGQMHLYLNYAREHWRVKGENPPVGLILCAEKDHAVARYALEGLPNKVMAAEYRTALPDEETLAEQVRQAQVALVRQRTR
jgi:hypothetical protein